MDLIGSLLSVFSPGAAARRAVNQYKFEILRESLDKVQKQRKYDAAGKSRRTDGWFTSGASPRAEVGGALKILRDRSRELVRNDPYIKKAVQVISTNTIGTGIMPTPLATTEGINKKLKETWKKWAGTVACDFDGKMNFYGLQKLVMRSVAESGEVIILKKVTKDKNAPLPFQLQVLEADFIDLNKTYVALKDGGKVLNGVEFDKEGRLRGYWLYECHPGDIIAPNAISNFTPMDEVIHVFYLERPGQHRGVPFAHPVMVKVRDFNDYQDAELMKQKVASCFAAFVQDNVDPSIVGSTNGDTSMSERIEPGIIEHLPPGKTVSFANPPSKEGYADFSRENLQSISAGLGITYEAMTGNLREVNFSSGRMGWLEFHRQVTDWQENMIIPQLCQRVWDWFILGCTVNQIISKPVAANWTVPRREMIDPAKETEGIKNAIRIGVMSWSEAVRQQGFEPDEVLKEIISDFDKFKENELQMDCDPRFDKGKIAPVLNKSDPSKPQ